VSRSSMVLYCRDASGPFKVSRSSMVLYCRAVSRPFNTSAPCVAMDSRDSRGERLQDAEESATKRQRASERKEVLLFYCVSRPDAAPLTFVPCVCPSTPSVVSCLCPCTPSRFPKTGGCANAS